MAPSETPPHDNLTENHMRLLEWLDAHPRIARSTHALDVPIADVEGLRNDLVDSKMIQRSHPLHLPTSTDS